MVALSFAAVPLYRMFCQATGYNGTTQRATTPAGEVLARTVTVRFDANTAPGLGWRFEPVQRTQVVHVGETSLAFFRATAFDFWGVVLCVAMMSISGLFYIIGGQFLISKVWRLVPISGFADGVDAWRFLILPVFIGVISGIGSSTRWYRTIFLEEVNKDYVRTARAKDLPETVVFFRHVLRNALIPILTGVVVIIPLLFMGSLLTESFFGIPGLGSYTIDAINAQDFAVVRSMVFIGSVLYIVGLILTDISYTVVDPRIRFE